MALGRGNIEIDVGTRVDTSGIAREVAAAERRLQPLNLRLDDKGFRQPLGRISGDLAEFEKSLDASVARTLAFGAAVGVINSVAQAFAGMVNNAKEVEKALMDVNVILNLSSKSLAQFSDDLFKVAKDTGQSFESVSEAAVELSRQGLGASETLKRINDAMILTRLSGMDAAKSVETLTAAVNSFGSTALDTTELVNKLASVDAAFAVSTEDLANALARAGSTAQGAKVNLDELLAAVTSVQQITARGGSVIGNAFKSIFTRIQRSSVREALEEIGVATQDATGQIRNAIDIIKDYSQIYKTLSDGQKAYTDELIAGVFQINNFKALVKDLSGEYSIYDRALKQSNSATDEAIRRNDQLQTTLSALVNEATVNVKSLSAALGELVATPAVENLLKIFNSVVGSVTKSLDGEGFIKKFVDGIGKFLSGPGLIVITVAFVKLFKFITTQAATAVGEIFSLGAAKEEVAETEAKIGFLLKNNYALYEAISNEAITHEQKEKLVLDTLNAQNKAYQRQESIIRSLAQNRAIQAAVAPSTSQGYVPRASKGFIPNFANGVAGAMESERRAISQGVGGASKSAKPKVIKNFPMGRGKKQTIVANTDEVVVPNYKGGSGSAIFNKKMIKQAGGKPKGAIPVSRGFIPNFAKGKKGSASEPDWAQEDPFKSIASSQYGSENVRELDLEAVLGGIGMIAARGPRGVVNKAKKQLPSTYLGAPAIQEIINDIAGSALDESEKKYLYSRLQRIGKIRYSNIGVSSISELDQGATNKLSGVAGSLDDVIGPYISQATGAVSRKIYTSLLGDEVDANALQKSVISGWTKNDLSKIVTVSTEGAIFEAAIRLGSKESSKNFGGSANAVWDFEEDGPVTNDMKELFFDSIGYPNIVRADAKRIGSDPMINEVLEKAYQTEGNTTWMRDKLKEWHEAHYGPLVESAVATKNAAGGFIPNFSTWAVPVDFQANFPAVVTDIDNLRTSMLGPGNGLSDLPSHSPIRTQYPEAEYELFSRYFGSGGVHIANTVAGQGALDEIKNGPKAEAKSYAAAAVAMQHFEQVEPYLPAIGVAPTPAQVSALGNTRGGLPALFGVGRQSNHYFGDRIYNGKTFAHKSVLEQDYFRAIRDRINAYFAGTKSGAARHYTKMGSLYEELIEKVFGANKAGGSSTPIDFPDGFAGNGISDYFTEGTVAANSIKNTDPATTAKQISGKAGSMMMEAGFSTGHDAPDLASKFLRYHAGTGSTIDNEVLQAVDDTINSVKIPGSKLAKNIVVSPSDFGEIRGAKADNAQEQGEVRLFDSSGNILSGYGATRTNMPVLQAQVNKKLEQTIIDAADSTRPADQKDAKEILNRLTDIYFKTEWQGDQFHLPTEKGILDNLYEQIEGNPDLEGEFKEIYNVKEKRENEVQRYAESRNTLTAANGLIPNLAKGRRVQGLGKDSEVYDNYDDFTGERTARIEKLNSGDGSGLKTFQTLINLAVNAAKEGMPITDIDAGTVRGPRIPIVLTKTKKVLDSMRSKGIDIPFMKIGGMMIPPSKLLSKLQGRKQTQEKYGVDAIGKHQYNTGEEEQLKKSFQELGLDPESKEKVVLRELPILQQFASGYVPNYVDIDDRKRAIASYESIKTKDWTQLKESGKQVRKRILNASRFFPLDPQSAMRTMYKDVVSAGDSERPYTDIEAGEIAGPRIPSIIVRAKEMLDRVRAKGKTLPLMNIDGYFEPTWLMGTMQRYKNEYDQGVSEGSNYYYPGEEDDLLEALVALGADPDSPVDFQLANSPLFANGFAGGLIPNFQLNKSKGKVASKEERQLERDLADAKIANKRPGSVGDKYIIDNKSPWTKYQGSNHDDIAKANNLLVNGVLPDNFIKTHPQTHQVKTDEDWKSVEQLIFASGDKKISNEAMAVMRNLADIEDRVLIRDDSWLNPAGGSTGREVVYDPLGQLGDPIFSKGFIPNFADLYRGYMSTDAGYSSPILLDHASIDPKNAFFDNAKDVDKQILKRVEAGKAIRKRFGLKGAQQDVRFSIKQYKIDDNNLNQLVSGVYTAGNLRKMRERSRWFEKNMEYPSEDLIAPSEWEDNGGKLGLGRRAPWDEGPEYLYSTYEEWEADVEELEKRHRAHESLRVRPDMPFSVVGTKKVPLPLATKKKITDGYGSIYAIPYLGFSHPDADGFSASDEKAIREIFSPNLDKPVNERDLTQQFLENTEFAYDLAAATKNEEKAINAARQRGLKQMQDHMARGFVPNFIRGLFDSDYLDASEKANRDPIVDSIINSGIKYDVFHGPPGAGKSTLAREAPYKLITGLQHFEDMKDQWTKLSVVSGAGPNQKLIDKGAKTGLAQYTTRAQNLLMGAERIYALVPDKKTLKERRASRAEIAELAKEDPDLLPDKRTASQLKSASSGSWLKGPDFALYNELEAEGIKVIKVASGGFIPNFSESNYPPPYHPEGRLGHPIQFPEPLRNLGASRLLYRHGMTTRSRSEDTDLASAIDNAMAKFHGNPPLTSFTKPEAINDYFWKVAKEESGVADKYKLKEDGIGGSYYIYDVLADHLKNDLMAQPSGRDTVTILKQRLKYGSPEDVKRYSKQVWPGRKGDVHGNYYLDPSERANSSAGGFIPNFIVFPTFSSSSYYRRRRNWRTPKKKEEKKDDSVQVPYKPSASSQSKYASIYDSEGRLGDPFQLPEPFEDSGDKQLLYRHSQPSFTGKGGTRSRSGDTDLTSAIDNAMAKFHGNPPLTSFTKPEAINDYFWEVAQQASGETDLEALKNDISGTYYIYDILKDQLVDNLGGISVGDTVTISEQGWNGGSEQSVERYKEQNWPGRKGRINESYFAGGFIPSFAIDSGILGRMDKDSGYSETTRARTGPSKSIVQKLLDYIKQSTGNGLQWFLDKLDGFSMIEKALMVGRKLLPKNEDQITDQLSNSAKKRNLIDRLKDYIEADDGGATGKWAEGYIPNFANALQEAIGREKKALKSQGSNAKIYVDQDRRLKNSQNPLGLLVANKRDEPRSGSQGVDRAIANRMDPKRHGAARGMIPNFASELTPSQQSSRSEMMDLIKWMEQVGDAAEDAAEEGDEQVRSLREQISAYKDLVNDGDSNERQLKELGKSLKDFFSETREEILDFKSPATNLLETPNLKLKDRSDEKADLNKQAEDIRGGREKVIQEFNKLAEAIERGAKDLDLPDEVLAAEIEKLGALDKKLKETFNVDTTQAMKTGALKTLDLGSNEKAESVGAKVRGDANKALLKQSQDVRAQIDKETAAREKLANSQAKSLQRILGLQMAMSQISSFTGFDMTGLQSAVGIYEGLDSVAGLGEKLGRLGPWIQGAAMAAGLALDVYHEFFDAEKQRVKLLEKEIETRKNQIDTITKNIEKIDQFADSTAKFSEATKTGDIDAAGKFMQEIFMSAQDIGQLDPQSFEDVIQALGDTEELNKSIDSFKKAASIGKDIKVVEQDIANISKTLAEQFDESQFLGIDAKAFTGSYIEDLDQFSDQIKTIGRTLTQNLDDDKALMLARALDGFDTALSDPAESLFALEGILGEFDASTRATLESNDNLSRGILDQVKIQNRYQAAVIKAKNAFKDVQKPITVLNSRLTDLSSALNIAAQSSQAAFDTLMEIGTIQGEANIESLKSTSTISERDLAAGQAAAQIKNSMEKSTQEQANALKSFANTVLGAPSDGTTVLSGTMKNLAEGIQSGSISNDAAMQALVEAQKNGTEDEKEAAAKTLEELRKINQEQIKNTAITNANLKAQLQKMDAQAVNAQRTTQLNDSQLKAFANMNQGLDEIKGSSLKTMEKIAEMTGVIQTLESIGADPSILAELKESNAQLNQLSVLRGAIESTTGESFDATNLRDLGNQIDDFIASNAFGSLSDAASDTVLAISSATDTGIRALQDAGIKGSEAAEQATLIEFQPDALTSLADTMSESISSVLAASLGVDSAVVKAVNDIGTTSGISELANEIITLSGQNEENSRQNLEAQKELNRAMIQAMQAADFAQMATSTSSLEKAAIKLEKAAELMIDNNSASGFVPNFAPSGGINASRFFNADYDAPALSRALNTESAMGAKKPVVDRHPSVGTYVRDAATQPNFAAVKRDHPEGLNQAVKNSRAIQSATAAKGFFPNFSVNSELSYPLQFKEGLEEYYRLKEAFGGGAKGATAITKVRATDNFRNYLWKSAFYKKSEGKVYERNEMAAAADWGEGKDGVKNLFMEAEKLERLAERMEELKEDHGLFKTQLPTNIDFESVYSGKEYRTREEGNTVSKWLKSGGRLKSIDFSMVNDLENVLKKYPLKSYKSAWFDDEGAEGLIARRASDGKFRDNMIGVIKKWNKMYQEEISANPIIGDLGDFSIGEKFSWKYGEGFLRRVGSQKYEDRANFWHLGNATDVGGEMRTIVDKDAMKKTEVIKKLMAEKRQASSSPYAVLRRKFDDFSAFTSIRDESIGQLGEFMKMKYSQTEWGRAISEISQAEKFKNSWRAAMVMKGRHGEIPSSSVKSFAKEADKNSDILEKVWGIGSGKEGLDFRTPPNDDEDFAKKVIKEPAAKHGEPNTSIDPSILYRNILTNGGYLEARFLEATGGSKNYKGPYQNWINRLPEGLSWSSQLIDGYDLISPVDDRIKKTVQNAVNGLALQGEVSRGFMPDEFAKQRMRDSMYDLINNPKSKFLVPLSFSGDFESGIDFSNATSLMNAADMENVLFQSSQALAAIEALYGNWAEGSKGRKLEKLKNGKEYFSEINERAKKYKTGFFDRLASLPSRAKEGRLEEYLKNPFYIDTTTGDIVDEPNKDKKVPSPEDFGKLIPDGPISTKDGYKTFVEEMFPEELQPNLDQVESYLSNLTSLQNVYNKIHPRGALDESEDNIRFLQGQLKELSADPDAEDLEFIGRQEAKALGLTESERKSENKRRSAKKTQRTERRKSLTEAITEEEEKAEALRSKIAGIETLDSKTKQEEKTDKESNLKRERNNLYLAVLGKQSRDARRAGGTGEFDTNFEGKRNKAIEAIKATKDYLRLESASYFNNRTPIGLEVQNEMLRILDSLNTTAPGSLNEDEYDFWNTFKDGYVPPNTEDSLNKFPVLKKLGFTPNLERGGLQTSKYSNIKFRGESFDGSFWDTWFFFDNLIGQNNYGGNDLFDLESQGNFFSGYPTEQHNTEADRIGYFENIITQLQKNKDRVDELSHVSSSQLRDNHFNNHIDQIRQYSKSKPFEDIFKKENEQNQRIKKSKKWWETEAPKHNEQLIAYYMSPFRQLNDAAQYIEGTDERGQFLYGKGFNAQFFQDNYTGPSQFKPVEDNPKKWPKYYKDYMDELKAQGIGSSAAEQALQGKGGRYKNDPDAMGSILEQYAKEIEKTGMDNLARWATIQVDNLIGKQWMNAFEAADGGKAVSAYTKGKDNRSQKHALSTERGQMLSRLGLIPSGKDFENFFGLVKDDQTSGAELIRSFAKNSDRGMQFFAHELSEAGGGDTLKEYQDYIINRIREVGVPFSDTKSIEDQFSGTIGWLEDIPGVKSSPVPVVDPTRLEEFIEEINKIQKKGMVDALSKWNPLKYDYSEDTTFAEIIGSGTVEKMNESELVKNPHYLKYLLQSNQTNAFLKQLNEGDDNAAEWDTFYNKRKSGYSLINQDDREKSILKNRNYGLPQVSEWVSTQDSISAAKRYDGRRSLSSAVGGVINVLTHPTNKNLQAALDSDEPYPFPKLYEFRHQELMGAEYLQDWILRNGDNIEAFKGSNYPFGYTPGEGTESPQWSDKGTFNLLMKDIVADATGRSLESNDPDAGKPLPKVQSARGFVPNFSKISGEIAASKAAGYKTPVRPSQVKSMSIPGVGKTSYNTQESVFKAAGMSQPFIAPPKDSKAAKPYAKAVQSKFNFNPYGKNFANGFVPNFAPPKSLTEQNKFNGQLLSAIKTLVSLDETQIKNQETQINILNKSLESNDSGASGNIDLMGFAEAIMNFSGNVTSSLLDFANKMHEYATSNKGDTSQADFSSLNKVSTNIKSGMDGLTEQLKNPLSIDASELNDAISAMQDIQLSVNVPNINVNVQGVTSAADQIKQSVASEVENRVRQLLSENSFTAQLATKINEWFGTNFS